MDETRMSVLEGELTLSRMLATVFLELPTAESLERVLALPTENLKGTESAEMLARFIAENRNRAREEVLLDVAKERATFVRFTGVGSVKPPYESVYVNAGQGETVAKLNRFYHECGYVQQEEARDAPDQIGIELSFLGTLLEREINQLKDGKADAAQATDATIDQFRSEHLSRWISVYGQQLIDNATSLYWKAIGFFIQEVDAYRS